MIHDEYHIDPASLATPIASYRSGDEAAGDHLCRTLLPVVRRETARMVGDADIEVDDVVQESLITCLRYLRAEQEFAGNLVRLTVTIARNRCRDLLRRRSQRHHVPLDSLETWLADTSHSPLEELAASERNTLLREALNQISVACRRLLHALYVEELTPEQLRVRSGLDSVQGLYYRRGVCLGQAKKILQRRLRFGSGASASPGADRNRRTGDSAI